METLELQFTRFLMSCRFLEVLTVHFLTLPG
jgi:hypothetical protein